MLLEPDVKFIKELEGIGGDSVRNVFNAQPVQWPAPYPRITNPSLGKK